MWQRSPLWGTASPTIFLDLLCLALSARSCSTGFSCCSPLFHYRTQSKHNAKQVPAITSLDLSSGNAKSVTVISRGIPNLQFLHILFWEMYLIKCHSVHQIAKCPVYCANSPCWTIQADLDASLKHLPIWKCCTVTSLIGMEACAAGIGLDSMKMQKPGRMGMVSGGKLLCKF